MDEITTSYMATHDMDRLFKEMMSVIMLKRPAKPIHVLVHGLHEICARIDRGDSEQLSYKDIFDAACAQIESGLLQSVQCGGDSDNGEDIFNSHSTDGVFQPDLHAINEHEDMDMFDSGDGSFGEKNRARVIPNRARVSASMMAESRPRRASVSAESYSPSKFASAPQKPVVYPKNAGSLTRIVQAVSRNLLFKNLDEDQRNVIFDAMFEKKVAAGVAVIVQGEEGDNFYVVDTGLFSVRVDGKEVVTIGPGGSFGELALMYNTKRSATVVALQDSVVWAVDRLTFRRVTIDMSYQKLALYEGFLRSVPLLKSLDCHEICRIADALQPVTFKNGEPIIRQGDVGDCFYIVVEGEVVVHVQNGGSSAEGEHAAASRSNGNGESAAEASDTSSPVEVGRLHRGDYFGELALLTNAPRAATVSAVGDVKCVVLSVADFIRLLGPVMKILERNTHNYSADGHTDDHRMSLASQAGQSAVPVSNEPGVEEKNVEHA